MIPRGFMGEEGEDGRGRPGGNIPALQGLCRHMQVTAMLGGRNVEPKRFALGSIAHATGASARYWMRGSRSGQHQHAQRVGSPLTSEVG